MSTIRPLHPFRALAPPSLRIPPPSPPHSRIRVGPDSVRPASPQREFVTLHTRRVDKERFDRIRAAMIDSHGRIPPLWEVFARLVDAAEDDLGLKSPNRPDS